MGVPREVIAQIRERTPIKEVVERYVTLKRAGNAWTGLCPFHQEKTPSFNVVPHKGIFHCFGCGEGGDVFRFLMKVKGLSFMEALKELAGPAGVTIEERSLTRVERETLRTRASLHDVCEAAARFYEEVLTVHPEGAAGRAYLEQRGLTRETIKRFRIGFAPHGWSGLVDHLQSKGFSPGQAVAAGLARVSQRTGSTFDFFRSRVLFPIMDERDRVVSFGGRHVDTPGSRPGDRPPPKYLNGSDTDIYHKQRTLYGLSLARTAIQREDRAILVEGYFDVVSLAQAGLEEAVATCGTALTTDQLANLRRLTPNVLALFDADLAGQKAAVKSLPLFAKVGMEAFRLDIPDAKDPDEFIRERGAEEFRALLQEAEPLMEMVIRFETSRFGTTPVGRQRALEALLPSMALYADVSRAALINRVADMLYLPAEEVTRQVKRHRGAPATPAPAAQTAPIAREVRDLLWLLVHHPEVAAPPVRQADPACLGESWELRDCIAGLLSGASVAELLDDTESEDLRRALAEVAANEALYLPERAEAATRQILACLEAPRIQERLAGIHQEIDGLGKDDDGEALGALLRERTGLQARLNQLKSRIPRSFR